MTVLPITTDRNELVTELEACGCRVKGKSTNCPSPSHEDQNASAGIVQSDDGQWRVKCLGCGYLGSVIDIRAMRLGVDSRDLFKELASKDTPTIDRPKSVSSRPSEPQPKTVTDIKDATERCNGYVSHHCYYHPDTGNIDLLVVKLKQFGKTKKNGKQKHWYNQWHQDGDKFINTAPTGLRPLFNRRTLAKKPDEPVVVVEGEDCVKCLHALGFVATTSPGGAKSRANADWSPIANRTVVLWQDDDKGGDSWANGDPATDTSPAVPGLNEILLGLGCTVWSVDHKKLNTTAMIGFDCVDLFNQQGGQAVAKAISDALGGPTITDMILDRQDRVLSGQMRTPKINLNGSTQLSSITKMLSPGNINILVASPGTGKSMLCLQIITCLIDNDVPTAAWLLEDGDIDHGKRMIAQLSKDANLLDEDHFLLCPDYHRQETLRHDARMQKYFKHIQTTDKTVTYDDVIKWCEVKAKSGCKVIIIDPIGIAMNDGEMWKEDGRLVASVNKISQKYECCILITTHPKKGNATPSLGNIGGGSAFEKFAQVVLWLSKCQMTTSMVHTGTTVHHNRTIDILKARNGSGGGRVEALIFDNDTLITKDLGTIVDIDLGEIDSSQTKSESSPLPPHDKYHTAPSDDEDLFNGR